MLRARRSLVIILPAALLCALPLWGQRAGGGTGQGQRARNLPQAVLHQGKPALRFEGQGQEGWAVFVDEVEYKGEPALRFPAGKSPDCSGALLVSQTHVALVMAQPSADCQGFDVPRSDVSATRQGGKVTLSSGANSYTYIPIFENGDQRRGGQGFPGSEYLVRAVEVFTGPLQFFRKATAGLTAAGTGTPSAPQGTAKKGKAELAEVTVTTQPGGAQVYVNDEPRGTSSEEEGRLVLRLMPGKHTLRVSLATYKDFTQDLTVVAGQPQAVTAKLEPVGPPPFTQDDIVKMLQGKVANKRIATLVNERGVDFALTGEIEKRLKALGADDDLLLAIATKKR